MTTDRRSRAPAPASSDPLGSEILGSEIAARTAAAPRFDSIAWPRGQRIPPLAGSVSVVVVANHHFESGSSE